MKYQRSVSITLAVLTIALGAPQSVLAGPPLICHAFDIGGAKSLPWIGGDRQSGRDWRGVDQNYDLGHLVADTLALLGPETPVIVRMETMRRAAVYAVWAKRDRKVGYTVKDDTVARQLLSELLARARHSDATGHPNALAWFDAGYLAESYKQAGMQTEVNGYDYILKAIRLRKQDAEMDFAAALITSDGTARKEHQEHLQKALAGAAEGSLLALNLVARYGKEGTTMGELRGQMALGKN